MTTKTDAFKICTECGEKIYKKYNSTLWDDCICVKKKASHRRIKKNKKILNTKTGRKGKTDKQKLEKKLDDAWSLLVKLRAGENDILHDVRKCAICQKAGQCAHTPGGMICPKDVECPI